MLHTTNPIIADLKNAIYDYISLANSPAEADMLRYLAFKKLNLDTQTRLNNYQNSWSFYDAIYDEDYHLPHNINYKIAEIFTTLKFENELSLSFNEKDLCPYHPELNNLSPILDPNITLDYQDMTCYKVTNAITYQNLNYKYYTTQQHLIAQIHTLNQTMQRGQRLQNMLHVKRIYEHPHFKGLIGQRGVYAKHTIKQGTIIDYYSGEYRQYPDAMPPMLCTWRVQKSHSWVKNFYRHSDISKFNAWTDAYILGNMMKLVNSCHYEGEVHHHLGNVACYYFHFKTSKFYISLPVYVAIKDIAPQEELLSFYNVSHYKNKRIYGHNL